MVILLALLALLVGGCGSSALEQTQEFEAQPTSRFASGEAIAIVQTWLGQRTYNYTGCTQSTALRSCPDAAKQQELRNCLEYVNFRPGTSDWSESFESNGVWRVKKIWFGGQPWVWDVYERSLSVRTVSAPTALTALGVVPAGLAGCR